VLRVRFRVFGVRVFGVRVRVILWVVFPSILSQKGRGRQYNRNISRARVLSEKRTEETEERTKEGGK